MSLLFLNIADRLSYLGIFTDFFTWCSEFAVNIVHFIKNIVQGFLSVHAFTMAMYNLLTVPLAWLPPILVSVAIVTIMCGILRAVL